MNDECLHCEHAKVPLREEPCRTCLRTYFIEGKSPSFEPDPNISAETAREHGERLVASLMDETGHLSADGRNAVRGAFANAVLSGIFSPAEFEKKMREVRGDEIEK